MEALDLISGINSSTAAAITLGGKTKSTGSGFDALLAALTSQSQQTLSQTAANTSDTGAKSASSATQDIQINSPADTPVAQLETALRQSGQPLEKITVPSGSREKLVEVLENSGYSTEDAQEILRRATDDEGNINLGAMFELLPQYTADQGPVLVLDQDAKIQLMQALNDLGVPAEEIRRFFESAEHIGQKIELKGITDLLAMADPSRSEVDRSVLEDLLGKLGLSTQEVETILDSKVDSQGRISPSDMLSLLETAAEKNDTKIATALKTLANQIEVQGDDTKEVVRQLRTMVSQALEQAPQKAAETQQTLQQTTQPQTLQAEGAQAEASQSTAATNAQSSGSATQNATTTVGEALASEAQTDTAKSAADILGKLGQEAAATARQDAATSDTGSQTGSQGGKSGDQALNQGLAQQAAANAKAATSTATQDSGSSKFNDALSAAQNSAARSAAGQGSGTVNKGIPAYVTRQVSQQMASMVRSGTPSLSLNLKPAHLGSLNVEVTMKDGNLQATLTADNVAAKQTLEVGLDLLREQLSQQGIKVDRIEVAVNADANQQQQQQTAQTSGQGGNGRNGDSSSGNTGTEDGQAAGSLAEDQSTTQTTARNRISIIA